MSRTILHQTHHPDDHGEDWGALPQTKIHHAFWVPERQLETSDGYFLCGKELMEEDVMMIFPLEAGKAWAGLSVVRYLKLCAFLKRLKGKESKKKAEQKVIEVEGSFKTIL